MSGMPDARLRRILATLFLFGSLGTGAELLLLEHVEGFWQVFPLLLLPVGCLALALVPTPAARLGLQIFQVMMALFIASGILGVLLHYRGNVEFELELHADAGGWNLFWEAMKGATPALAPGTMILLGGVGLAYTYRHPALVPNEGTRLESLEA